MIDVNLIKKDFPILERKFNGKRMIYLDSTATSQKPIQVIEAISDYYKKYNANVHRGIYDLSEEATDLYEKSRKNISLFINSKKAESIVFVRNTTEALNLLSYTLGRKLKSGDEIITTVMEHHSNIVPWQFLQEKGIKIKYVDIDENGILKMEQFNELITNRTKIVTVTQASNVLGTINDVEAIGKIAHDYGAYFIVDGAQSVPHMPVDVQFMDCDFLAFSGHKMLGPMGIGVLFGKKEILEDLDPFMGGGEMINEVHMAGSTWAEVPLKFEAGTPNVEGALGLSVAVDYLKKLGMENVRDHEKELVKYAIDMLDEIKDVMFYGPRNAEIKGGVIAFNFKNVKNASIAKAFMDEGIMIHPHDVASILDMDAVMVRSGHHCAQPLMDRLGVPATSRASFYIYNDKEDVDKFISALGNVKRVLKL